MSATTLRLFKAIQHEERNFAAALRRLALADAADDVPATAEAQVSVQLVKQKLEGLYTRERNAAVRAMRIRNRAED